MACRHAAFPARLLLHETLMVTIRDRGQSLSDETAECLSVESRRCRGPVATGNRGRSSRAGRLELPPGITHERAELVGRAVRARDADQQRGQLSPP